MHNERYIQSHSNFSCSVESGVKSSIFALWTVWVLRKHFLFNRLVGGEPIQSFYKNSYFSSKIYYKLCFHINYLCTSPFHKSVAIHFGCLETHYKLLEDLHLSQTERLPSDLQAIYDLDLTYFRNRIQLLNIAKWKVNR